MADTADVAVFFSSDMAGLSKKIKSNILFKMG
jgi:hypothetical protein